MGIRYDNRAKRRNSESLYEDVLEARDMKSVVQYTTPKFPRITQRMRATLVRNKYVWKMGDSYQRVAEVYYGDPKMWWVLAWYNKKPTDALVKIGDTIRIPQPLERVLEFFGV
jgi:nucleoid-associated protein YgaU